jgi:hypothetical protein
MPREAPWVEHMGDGDRLHADDDGPYAETASTAWMSVGSLDLPKD